MVCLHKKILVLIITILYSMLLISGCSDLDAKSTFSTKAIVEKADTSQKDKFFGAVFQRGDKVYVYNGASDQIKVLGGGSGYISLVGLSRDKKRAAFSLNNEALTSPKIGIYDIKSSRTNYINLINSYAEQLSSVTWVDNSVILAEGHVNPDVEGYVIYDVETGKEINYCGGIFYEVLSDNKSMLFRMNPHVFPHINANITLAKTSSGRAERLIELYRADSSQEEIYDASISKDLSKICFWTYIQSKNQAYVNIADFSYRNSKISNIKKYKIEAANGGELEFDGRNNVIAKIGEYEYRLKGSSYVKNKISRVNKANYIDKNIINKFNAAYNKYFKQDNLKNMEPERLEWFELGR